MYEYQFDVHTVHIMSVGILNVHRTFSLGAIHKVRTQKCATFYPPPLPVRSAYALAWTPLPPSQFL